MAKSLLPDELWELIRPLLPAPGPRRFRYPGRKPVGDREALTGIPFVLRTGIQWEDLPAEVGCGCGMTCWRRLRAWQEAGVWCAPHQLLLTRLDHAGKIDWSRAAVDGTFARAFGGVEGSGPNPTDRGRPGVKQHLPVDAGGVPVAGITTAANVNEVTQLVPLADAAGPQLPGVDRSTDRGPCTGTARTTRNRTARRCGTAPSTRIWPSAERNTAVGWGCADGWPNAPTRGGMGSASSGS